MKISEFKNENAVELLADLIEPASVIFSDKDIVDNVKAGKPVLVTAKLALKKHSKEVVEILAIMDGTPVENYTCNPISIMRDLIVLLSDKELLGFFQSQAQMMENESSTFAMENIKEEEE